MHRKMYYIAVVIWIVCFPVLGLAQVYVNTSFGYNRTALPNASDTSSQYITLDYKHTYRFAGGMDIGYRFESSFGLSGMFFGLSYMPVAQNYGFAYYTPTLVSPSRPTFSEEFTTSLKYLRGSVSTEFTLISNRKDFRLTLSPGFYVARLLSFHDGERGDGGWRKGTANQTFFLFPPIFDTALIVKQIIGPAYRKWDYGPRLAIGAEFPLSETAALTFSVHGTYGIRNAESEDAELEIIEPIISTGGGTQLVTSAELWYEREGRFMVLPSGISTGDVKRNIPTHTLTTGVSIGLRLAF